MGLENGARVAGPFQQGWGLGRRRSAQLFSEWHLSSTCCLRLMNVLRKTNNPRLKNRRGKSYLLDFFFQKFVTHAFPLKSSYLLVPLCFEAAWQIIYLPRHEAPRLFSQCGASCEQHMWPQRPPPWLAAHLPPTCVHAPTGAYLPATDEEAASTGLPALALLQCKISRWE